MVKTNGQVKQNHLRASQFCLKEKMGIENFKGYRLFWSKAETAPSAPHKANAARPEGTGNQQK
jgi:hypothetical protein